MKKKSTNQSRKGRTNPKYKKNEGNNISTLLGLAIIVVLGVIIYSNSFDCSFHLDDTKSIVQNNSIRDLSDVNTIWNYSRGRFIAYCTFALNYHFGELNVEGYHLVNLLIHLINAGLVYFLTFLIFSSPALNQHPGIKDKNMIAFFTALLFVSHPLATGSVTYIVQRMASLVSLFYFLSVALYMKMRMTEKGTLFKYGMLAGAIISAVLAMYTKQNAFTLPLAIVLVELCFFQTPKNSINLKNYRVLSLIGGLVGFVFLILSRFSLSIFNPVYTAGDFFTVTPYNYLLTQFSVIVKYVQLLILPIGQNLDHEIAISNSFFELRTIISFLFLSAIIVLAILQFKKNRLLSFGIFWFFLNLSIESSIIPLSDLIFEHRTYLPSFGFFLMLSSGIYIFLWEKHKFLAMAILLLIIGSNSILTYERNKVWIDDLSLWNDVISKAPNKSRPYFTRGLAYLRSGQNKEALADFNRAIEISPRYFKAYMSRGNVYMKSNQNEKAIADYNKAIDLEPGDFIVYYNRARAYGKEDTDKALLDYNKAIDMNPKHALSFNNRGDIYNNLKQWNKAVDDFSKAIELDPQYAIAYSNLGSVYNKLKQWEKSIDVSTKAIELNPNFSKAYNNRGVAHVKLEQWDKALIDFTKAFENDPNNTVAKSNLDIVKKKLNNQNN